MATCIMVTDHRTKRVARSWRGGTFHRHSFQLGWVPPHPTFYMRKEVAQKVGDYDLSYVTTADYDYMLRALALNDFRARYIPRVIADFQIGGISTRGLGVTLRGNLECLRSRREHLNAPVIDAAFFLRFARRIFQIRRSGSVTAGPLGAASSAGAVEPNSGTASFKHRLDGGPVIAGDRLFQRRKPFAQGSHRRLVGLGRHDSGDADLDGGLLGGEQDFVQPLARPHSGEDDLDIVPGLQAGQPDHALGEIDDLDRLAHVEHVHRDVRPAPATAHGLPR